MIIRIYRKAFIAVLIFYNATALLQGASEHTLPARGAKPLVSQAMHVLLRNFKQTGEHIDAANYTEVITDQKNLYACIYSPLTPQYNTLIMQSFGWQKLPYLLKIVNTSNYQTALTDLIFTNEAEFYATDKSRRLYEQNIETGCKQTMKLLTGGRNIALSYNRRFLAVLMHNRRMMIWDKEANNHITITTPIFYTTNGGVRTSLKKIEFDEETDALIGTIHNRRDVISWNVEQLFSDAPQGFWQTKTFTYKAPDYHPKAFCHTGQYAMVRTQETEYLLPHPAKPKVLTFSPDYTHLAVGMENGQVAIWHFPGHLYYLLQCAISKTLQSNNPQDYETLAAKLQGEQDGPYAQLPHWAQTAVLSRLKNGRDRLVASTNSLNTAESYDQIGTTAHNGQSRRRTPSASTNSEELPEANTRQRTS